MANRHYIILIDWRSYLSHVFYWNWLKVADLSHHFALEHAQKSANKLNNNNNYTESKPVANNSVFLNVVEPPNVIPIYLPIQPLPEDQLRYDYLKFLANPIWLERDIYFTHLEGKSIQLGFCVDQLIYRKAIAIINL